MASSSIMSVNDITEKLRSHRIGSLEDGNGRAVKTEPEAVCRVPAIAAVCKIRHRSEPLAATPVANHQCRCQCRCGCSNGDGRTRCAAAFGCAAPASGSIVGGGGNSGIGITLPPLHGARAATNVLLISSAADALQPACPPCKKPCRLRSGAAAAAGAAGAADACGRRGTPSSPAASPSDPAPYRCLSGGSSLQRPVALRPGSRQSTDGGGGSAPCRLRFAPTALPSPPPLGADTDAVAGYVFAASPLLCSFSDRTSPESPLLRPLSASSGFYDGSGSSLSGCSITELSGGAGGGGGSDGGLASSSSSRLPLPLASPRHAAFGERCQSVEERASSGSGGGASEALGSGGSPVSFSSAVSLPSVAAAAAGTASAPSSPRRLRPPRCRSQPCDLQRERFSGGGVKRRHEDERPSLDFDKMTETAYDFTRARASSCCRPRSSPMSVRCHCRHNDVRLSTLQTIASSPLDVSTILSGGYTRRSPLMSCGSPTMSPPLVSTFSVEHCVVPQLMLKSSVPDPGHCDGEEENEPSDHEDDISSAEQFPIDLNGELDLEQIEQD